MSVCIRSRSRGGYKQVKARLVHSLDMFMHGMSFSVRKVKKADLYYQSLSILFKELRGVLLYTHRIPLTCKGCLTALNVPYTSSGIAFGAIGTND